MTSIDHVWSDISAHASSLGAFRLLDEAHPLDLFAGIDHEGRRALMLVTDTQPREVPAAGVIEVTVTQRNDGLYALLVRLSRQELQEVFGRLCMDLVEGTRTSTKQSGTETLLKRLNRWRRLLEAGARQGLSNLELRGLFGELWFLWTVAIPVFGDAIAIQGWNGPLEAPHDFQLGDGLVEVKTILPGAHSVSIASADQLESGSIPLQLAVIVTDISKGVSVPELAETIRRGVEGTPIAATEFELRLAEAAFTGRLLDEVDESTPEHSLALLLQQQRKQIARLRLYLISDGALSTRVKDWPEGQAGGIPTEFHIWDINRFHQVYESKTGRDELTVDFTQVVPGGLPCLAASVDADNYRAYLCVIPGSVLASIYQQYGSRLLEGNVRSFLGASKLINKKIRKTVMSEPTMFFAYNNGISATATSTVTQTTDCLRITEVTDLQIVNGGQTTAILANALSEKDPGLEKTFVQMKLSVIPPETIGEYTPQIALCANTQNKVSDADFYSNREFHRRIEQISRVLRAPAVGGAQYGTHWLYERARGTYLNEQAKLTPAQRALFQLQNPRKQLITKVDLAKFENAWRYLPNVVSLGAQKNFVNFSSYAQTEWEKNPEQFNEEYYKRVIVKAMLFRKAEELVSDQSWYQGGYRANIVAYTIAKFAHLIQFEGTGDAFDFKACWTRQSLSPAIESQLTLIAYEVFEVIVSPDGGLQNVTEWAKKEVCWSRVQGLRVPLQKELANELVGRENDRAVRKDAEAQQTIMSGIQIQMTVVNLGPLYWKQLHTWAKSRSLLSPEDESFVSVASGMPRKLPTEKQSARLLQIKERVEVEGFLI